MTKEYDAILAAKKSTKINIEFFELILKHLNGTDKELRARACYTAWCLHEYINNRLIHEVSLVIEKNTPKNGGH